MVGIATHLFSGHFYCVLVCFCESMFFIMKSSTIP